MEFKEVLPIIRLPLVTELQVWVTADVSWKF